MAFISTPDGAQLSLRIISSEGFDTTAHCALTLLLQRVVSAASGPPSGEELGSVLDSDPSFAPGGGGWGVFRTRGEYSSRLPSAVTDAQSERLLGRTCRFSLGGEHYFIFRCGPALPAKPAARAAPVATKPPSARARSAPGGARPPAAAAAAAAAGAGADPWSEGGEMWQRYADRYAEARRAGKFGCPGKPPVGWRESEAKSKLDEAFPTPRPAAAAGRGRGRGGGGRGRGGGGRGRGRGRGGGSAHTALPPSDEEGEEGEGAPAEGQPGDDAAAAAEEEEEEDDEAEEGRMRKRAKKGNGGSTPPPPDLPPAPPAAAAAEALASPAATLAGLADAEGGQS